MADNSLHPASGKAQFMNGQPVCGLVDDLEMAAKSIRLFSEAEHLARCADIPEPLAGLVIQTAQDCGLSLAELRSDSRWRPLVRARQKAIKRARACSYSYWQIGRALNRDHSTIIHAEKAGLE